MPRKCLVLLVVLLWSAPSWAAYIGSPVVEIQANTAQQPVGVQSPALPTIPLLTGVSPTPVAFPTPPYLLSKNAILPDVFGRSTVEITDGRQIASLVPPYSGAGPGQPALAVALSPTPNYQCPLTQAINTTANVTAITNPGGKNIYVCNAAVVNGATAQSVTISEGTGTTCGTGTTYWLGGAGGTAALAANGGFALLGINWAMQKNGDNVCVLISGSTNVSGSLTYGFY